MAYIEWNELRRLTKQFTDNDIVRARLDEAWRQGATCQLPNPVCGRSVFQADLKTCIAELIRRHPANWQEGVPERIVEWFREEPDASFILNQGEKKKEEGYFAKIPFWLIDEFMRYLTPPEFMVLIAFVRFANFGSGVNKKGLRHGETFVGRERIAEMTGLSVPSVDRIIKSLTGKDHLPIVRRGKNHVVRMVAYMQEEVDQGPVEGPPPEPEGVQCEMLESRRGIKSDADGHIVMPTGIKLDNAGRVIMPSGPLPRRPGIAEDLSDEGLPDEDF